MRRPLQIALSICFSADKELAGYVESMDEITSAEATDFESSKELQDMMSDAPWLEAFQDWPSGAPQYKPIVDEERKQPE